MSSNTRLFRQPAVRRRLRCRNWKRPRAASTRTRGFAPRSNPARSAGPARDEVEVAQWLDVSRTPVRDALRRLESEGMLTVEPRMGLVVASISRPAMLELYVMREVLEARRRDCARATHPIPSSWNWKSS